MLLLSLERIWKLLPEFCKKIKLKSWPVVGKDGKLVGLITYKDITKAKDKPMACKDSKGRLRVAAGVGVTADTLQRMEHW